MQSSVAATRNRVKNIFEIRFFLRRRGEQRLALADVPRRADRPVENYGEKRRPSLRRRREKRISKMFLTRLCVAATLDCTSSSASLLANGGKEVTLQYRFTIDSNWPLGTRVDIRA